MKIQVLGTGCTRCKTLAANAEQAVKEAGVDAEVVKIQEISDILAFDGVPGTPRTRHRRKGHGLRANLEPGRNQGAHRLNRTASAEVFAMKPA